MNNIPWSACATGAETDAALQDEQRRREAEHVANILRTHYGLVELHSIACIYTGPASKTWMIKGLQGDKAVHWCVKRCRGKTTERASAEFQLFKALHAQGFNLVPEPVCTLDSRFSVADSQFSTICVCEYIEADPSAHWLNGSWSCKESRSAGSVLARFHTAATRAYVQLDKNTKSMFAAVPLSSLRTLFHSAIDKFERSMALRTLSAPWEPGWQFIAKTSDALKDAFDDKLSETLARRGSGDRVSRTLAHGDFHPANLLFRDCEVTAVLDLDYAQWDLPALYDLGYGALLFSWRRGNGSGELDNEMIEHFIDGYNELAFSCVDKQMLLERPIIRSQLTPWLRLSALLVLYWLLDVAAEQPQERDHLELPVQQLCALALSVD